MEEEIAWQSDRSLSTISLSFKSFRHPSTTCWEETNYILRTGLLL